MANVLRELFTNIASAIKEKTGDNATMKPAEFPDKIRSIDVSETLEDLPIALDFSGGDQEVVAPDGFVVKSAVIQKPETLIPDNIAEGVNIAGIIGLLPMGSNVKVASGKNGTTSFSTPQIIEHNLGVIPDLVIAICSAANSSNNIVACYCGVSNAFGTKIGRVFNHMVARVNSGVFKGFSYAYGLEGASSSAPVGHATETTIRFYADESMKFGSQTIWIAIAGLT